MTDANQPRGTSLASTTTLQTCVLALMRIAIGWHFLYEGIVKLLDADWTAAGYLEASTGPMAGAFQWIASDPTVLGVVNQLNIWGLILIGGCLMLGLFSRLAALGGIGLLAMYYASNPPLFDETAAAGLEGHYLLVNKNLVELLALGVVLFLPAGQWGLDGLLFGWRKKKPRATDDNAGAEEPALEPAGLSRRQLVATMAGVPFVGGLVLATLKRHGWQSHEEEILAEATKKKVDAHSGASLKIDFSTELKDLKAKLPQAQIGDLKLSRMLLGGNLMGGWAHARDLLYTSKLVKAYHHREKVFETFALAESCGVNTILTNPVLCDVISDYWRSTGGKIQFISDCGGSDMFEATKRSIDVGASACYLHGGMSDTMVARGEFDKIEKLLELIRKNGLPAGIGGHKLETVKGCVDKGILPDFWMKTLHHGKYWSAFGGEEQKGFEHDHFWCWRPDEVVDYMKELKQPWIAFKILAAGAIHPRDGFRYAFEGGADFICVGMYDFQVVEDVNIALDVLAADLKRKRDWIAPSVEEIA